MQNISESLRRQREQLLGDSSEDLLGRHASLLDIAIISLYNRLANRSERDTERFRSSGAVLALGAFGRGIIGPSQALPIIFLKADSSLFDESWLYEIASPLTEAGWTVDAQQATVAGLIERAREDFSFFLQLLDARYISGNRQLAEQLDKALEAYIEGRQEELLVTLRASVRSRLARLDQPESWLEPDLEANPGALGEIYAIRAACRIASNIRGLDDAIFRGYLTRQEVDFLLQSEKTYARFLSLLQIIPGNASSVLRFGDQEQLAEKLGYSARAGFLPVEAFMQRVFQLFHGVFCISNEFWERLLEARSDAAIEESGADRILEPGLLVRSEKIHIQTDQYPADAAHLVHLFSLAAKHGLGFANVARQWIQHHRNVLDTASGDPLVQRELLELIRSDAHDLPVLRRFYDLGLMSSLIPELAPVHGLVQHDAFHLYPVDEHHLRTLMELKKLFSGDYMLSEPEVTHVAQSISDPTCLFLAGLLHDIGKSSGKGHAARGGEMIPAIARRLGLAPEESDMVQFLVAQHLLLLDSASLRDLADEEMLANCAAAIASSERLDLLAALGFADMAATGPKAQQKWRDTPVMTLYQRVHHLLEKGEPSSVAISERIDHLKAQVGRLVTDLMDSAQLEEYFSQLAPRYLLSMPPSAVARHLRLQCELKRSTEALVSEVTLLNGTAEITLVSLEMPGLVSKAAGILTLHDMNIIGAQGFSMENGVAILVFQCRLPENSTIDPDWNALTEDLRRLRMGKIALDYRIAAHAAEHPSLEPPIRPVKSQIFIDNESSALYTILEVYTIDRVGLLYTISRTLFDLQIRIYVAKITTKVDQVADVFYIKTSAGEKVTDPEQMQELENALRFWLDGPESR